MRWFAAAIATVVVAFAVYFTQSGDGSWWKVAVCSGAAAFVIAAQLWEWWRSRARTPFTYEAPSENEFRRLYDGLAAYAESLGPVRPGMLESALFLLEEARRDFERVSNSSDSHEEKARIVLGVVAGATGALGIFGVAREGRPIVATPTVLDALVFVAVAFVCLLYVLRVKHYKRPDLAAYFAGAMLDEKLRVALPLSLLEGYGRMTAEFAHSIRHEPRALFVAYVSIVAAAVLIILGAAASVSPVASSGTGRSGPQQSSSVHVTDATLSWPLPVLCAVSAARA